MKTIITIEQINKGNEKIGYTGWQKKCIIETGEDNREELLGECMRAIIGIGYHFPYEHHELMDAIDYVIFKNDEDDRKETYITGQEGPGEIIISGEDIDL